MPPHDLATAVAAIRSALPGFEVHDARAIRTGWDSFVVETDDEWIFRFPRDDAAEDVLRREVALLPALSRALPVSVPDPEHFVDGPVVFVGYRKIDGRRWPEAASTDAAADAAGASFGAFLDRLHALPLGIPLAAGLTPSTPQSWRADQERMCAGFERTVLPVLPRDRRDAAAALLRSFLEDDRSFRFAPVLIHYDLGPTHLFFGANGSLTGVIDWSDAAIGDPAVDLAWALNATPRRFRDALVERYRRAADPGVAARAAFYHRIGPWHEVVHGLDTGEVTWVTTGVAGVVDRLPPA